METVLKFILHNFGWFGLAGSGTILLGIGIAAGIYRGRRDERYSLFNHFISELGEVGVSPAAWLFNVSLVLGGLFLAFFSICLGVLLGGWWGMLGLIAGLTASLAVAAVGVFPMNNLAPHTRAAMTYFRAGLLMVLFFGAGILAQPEPWQLLPPALNLLSLMCIAAYGSFLLLLTRKNVNEEITSNFDPAQLKERPRFWLLPFLEWLVFFSTMLWLFGVAVFR